MSASVSVGQREDGSWYAHVSVDAIEAARVGSVWVSPGELATVTAADVAAYEETGELYGRPWPFPATGPTEW